MSERGAVDDAEVAVGRTASKEVKSAARTLDVLEYLAARGSRGVRVRELSEALKAPRSSVYAVIRTLLDRGWVRTDATGMLYSIGLEALMVGTTYLEADPILRIVQPQVTALSRQLGETVHYGRLRGTDMVYLASEESRQYVRPFGRIGRRLPAFTNAMGKALLADRLAAGGRAEVTALLPDALMPLTPRTLVDPTDLFADLDATRTRGYAVDREENYAGISCVAVAIRFAHPPQDSLSCSIPTERLTAGREQELVEALRATRHAIEAMAPHTPMTAHGSY